PRGRPATLLALGDPAYPEATPGPDQAPPPGHGLRVATVEPYGLADLFGVTAGDVLLEYNGTTLRAPGDLQEVPADGRPKPVPLRLWRAGEVRALEVAAGPLGIRSAVAVAAGPPGAAFDPRPVAPVVLARRSAAEVLRGTRGGSWKRLPRTRDEVTVI